MNVYDFDKTIYKKDTTAQFYLWSLRRWPKIARRWPGVIAAAACMAAGQYDKTAFKGVFLRFLADVPDPQAELERFWNANMALINGWFLKENHARDVVITASPVDFVRPACLRLGIGRVFGSPVDIRTGVYHGVNCHGEEKARVFRAAFPNERIEAFYSDSLNDAPLARLAERAYLVKGERLTDWPGKEHG